MVFAVRSRHTLLPEIQYDPEALRVQWEALPCVVQEAKNPAALEIRLTEEGYQLYDGRSARLNAETGFQALKAVLERGETVLDLAEAGAYENFPMGAA